MNAEATQEEKKGWVTPKLIRYGNVEEITKQTKPKWYGSGDDLIDILS